MDFIKGFIKKRTNVMGIVGCFLVIIGTFLPYTKLGGEVCSLYDIGGLGKGDNMAVMILGASLVGIILFLLGLNILSFLAWWVDLISSLMFNKMASKYVLELDGVKAKFGLGQWVIICGVVIMFVSAIIGKKKRKKQKKEAKETKTE